MKFPFTQELADTICERLIDGESLRTICRDEGMPSAALVCKWLGDESNASFREQYARAREAQADTLTDEMLDIADNGTNDWMTKRNGDGEPGGFEYNGDAVQRARLRIDTRKWYASKLAPKKYGDKTGIEISGSLTLAAALDALDDPE